MNAFRTRHAGFSTQKNYPEITRQISANVKKLRKDIPDTLQGFSAMAKAACSDGALDKKELIALALVVRF